MAIARAGTPVDGGNNGGASTSLTFAVTVPSSGSLVVGFAGDVSGGADDVVSVVFNTSESLTILKKNTTAIGRYLYLYVIAAPTATTANVVITCTGTHYILGGAVMYTGIQAASQPDTTASVSNISTTTVTTSFTTATANDWGVLIGGWYNANQPLTSGTGGSRLVFDAAFGSWALFDTNADLSTGANTMSITGATPNPVDTAMAALIPATGGGGSATYAPSSMPLTGVQ